MAETHNCSDARTITLDVLQSDGTVASVTMSVVNIRDASGSEIRFSDRDVLLAILYRLDFLCRVQSSATGFPMIGASDLPLN